MTKDLALFRRLMEDKLRTDTCRLCLCELLDDYNHVSLTDTLVTKSGETTVKSFINEIFPDLSITSWLQNALPDKVCLPCFTEVRTSSFNPALKPNLTILKHYVNELYENLENSKTLSEDIKTMVIYIPLYNADEIIEQEKPKHIDPSIEEYIKNESGENSYEVPIIKEEMVKTECEFEDAMLLTNENGDHEFIYTLNENMKVDSIFCYTKTKCKPNKPNKQHPTTEPTKHVIYETEDEERELIPKLRTKRTNPIYCLVCLKKYYSRKWLTQHSLKVHKMIFCVECGMNFSDVAEYKRHVVEKPAAYSCYLCAKWFKFKHSIILHLNKHEKEKSQLCVCEICGAQLWDAAALENHTALRHSSKSIAHTCYYCGKGYKGLVSFEAHIQKHVDMMEKDKDQCRDCGGVHLLKTPSPSSPRPCKPHLCQQCGKSYSSLDSLKNHVRSHDKQREHQCQICDRSFVDARALRWHGRLHSGERPYRCNECGRNFVSRNRRNQHALTAHSAPQKQCPLCPALFHLRSMVNTHIKKVHLRAHVRRARAPRQYDFTYNTEKVAFSDLSVPVQTHLLEKSLHPNLKQQ